MDATKTLKKYRITTDTFFFERVLHLTPHPLQLYSQIEFYLLVDYYIQSKPITFLFLKHTKEPFLAIANKILQRDTCKASREVNLSSPSFCPFTALLAIVSPSPSSLQCLLDCLPAVAPFALVSTLVRNIY